MANSSINSEDRGYLYDAAWNLVTRTNAGGEENFTANVKNELDSTPYGTATYDDNGNLLTRLDGEAEWDWAYDDENQLIYYYDWIEGRQYGFGYDGLGRLRSSWEWAWDEGEEALVTTNETRYIYDGKRVIQERDDDTGTVSYTRGNDISGSMEGTGGIGGMLARSEYASSTWTNHAFYHADGNGNVTQLIDVSQTSVASYRYDPFGNTISQNGTLADTNKYRFSSKRIHSVSGMYYYGYRWYVPTWQRWLNRDPIEERGGMNLYGFVGSNPISRIDPQGLDYYGGGKADFKEKFACLWDCGVEKTKKGAALAAQATAEAARRFPRLSGHNDAEDAWRHYFWSCQMARAIGRDCARAIANNHEDGGDRHNQPKNEREMDQHNNIAGRWLSSEPGECADLCQKALDKGNLKISP